MRDSSLEEQIEKWGERVFNGGPVTRTPSRRGMTGLKIIGPGKSPRSVDAASVRRRVGLIVKRAPQVLVKISGGGKSIDSVKAHLDYISRSGEIELEDQNGDKLNGRDDVADLRNEWRDGGFPMSERGQSRQAFNVVLSMPAGTDEAAVLRAARDFALEEFANYQYAMALHTFDTDPGKEPSPNPHVHICVKAVGMDGTRLNPRKSDLQRWREVFAEKLREHGVEADASRRVHRLQRARGEKQAVRYVKARQEPLHSIGRSAGDSGRADYARWLERTVLGYYRELASVLATSDKPHDRQLAIGLAKRVSGPPVDRSREQDQQRDRTPDGPSRHL